MLFLYDLPHWLMLLLIVAVTMLIGVGGHVVCRRFIRFHATEEQKAFALAVLPIVATVHSLLLAFSAVSVWESFSSSTAAVVAEANTVGQLARDLAVFDSPESAHARKLLKEYSQLIVDAEWNDMRHGEANPMAWTQFDELFRAVSRIVPDTPKREAMMYEVFNRVNELVKLRRDRLHESTAAVPSTLWTVVLVGTLLTMALTLVFPDTRFNLIMIAALTCSIGLVFSFIVGMDRPYAGRESISPRPFLDAIANMDRWDRETQTQPR